MNEIKKSRNTGAQKRKAEEDVSSKLEKKVKKSISNCRYIGTTTIGP